MGVALLLLVSVLLMGAPLLLVEGPGVVDEVDERIVAVVTDAVLHADVEVALVGSMEVLLGVVPMDITSDEEESLLTSYEAVFGVNIIEGALEDSALDGEKRCLRNLSLVKGLRLSVLCS